MVKYKVQIKSPLPSPLPCRVHDFFFFLLWLYRYLNNFITVALILCLVLMPCDAIWTFIFHDVKILSFSGASLCESLSALQLEHLGNSIESCCTWHSYFSSQTFTLEIAAQKPNS